MASDKSLSAFLHPKTFWGVDQYSVFIMIARETSLVVFFLFYFDFTLICSFFARGFLFLFIILNLFE